MDTKILFEPDGNLPVIADIYNSKLTVTFCADAICAETLYTRKPTVNKKAVVGEGPLMAVGYVNGCRRTVPLEPGLEPARPSFRFPLCPPSLFSGRTVGWKRRFPFTANGPFL